MTASSALKVVKGELTLASPETLSNDDWVLILKATEAKTVESVLRMCYVWNVLFEECKDDDEAKFSEIYEACGISAATASKRAQIGSHSNLLLSHTKVLPTGIESLVGLARIPNEQLGMLLKDGSHISPELSREQAKNLKDAAASSRTSAKYSGNIIEYLEDKSALPAPTEEQQEEIQQEEKTAKSARERAKSKKAQADASNQAKLEQQAAKKKLTDIDYLNECLLSLVQRPIIFERVMDSLKQFYHPDMENGSTTDFNEVTAIEEVLGSYIDEDE